MKAINLIKISAFAVGVLIVSACSGKKSNNDSQSAPTPAPTPAATSIYSLPSGFNNSPGVNPQESIKGSAIQNATFKLVDMKKPGHDFKTEIYFHFDQNGVLSVDAAIDTAAFTAPLPQQPGQYDYSNRSSLVFRGTNIPYGYDSFSREIRINNFVITATDSSNKALKVSAAKTFKFIRCNYNEDCQAKEDFMAIDGDLTIDSSIQISPKLAIEPGTITAQTEQRPVYQNGEFQFVQITKETFTRDASPNHFLVRKAVLKPY